MRPVFYQMINHDEYRVWKLATIDSVICTVSIWYLCGVSYFMTHHSWWESGCIPLCVLGTVVVEYDWEYLIKWTSARTGPSTWDSYDIALRMGSPQHNVEPSEFHCILPSQSHTSIHFQHLPAFNRSHTLPLTSVTKAVQAFVIATSPGPTFVISGFAKPRVWNPVSRRILGIIGLSQTEHLLCHTSHRYSFEGSQGIEYQSISRYLLKAVNMVCVCLDSAWKCGQAIWISISGAWAAQGIS